MWGGRDGWGRDTHSLQDKPSEMSTNFLCLCPIKHPGNIQLLLKLINRRGGKKCGGGGTAGVIPKREEACLYHLAQCCQNIPGSSLAQKT